MSAHAHYSGICAQNEQAVCVHSCKPNRNPCDELQRDKRAAKVYQSLIGEFIVCFQLEAWRIAGACAAAPLMHAAPMMAFSSIYFK